MLNAAKICDRLAKEWRREATRRARGLRGENDDATEAHGAAMGARLCGASIRVAIRRLIGRGK